MSKKKRHDFLGNKQLKKLQRIPREKEKTRIERELELGLESAPSINDRTISLFSRGFRPTFAGLDTFMRAPYCEDVRRVSEYDAAFVGVPFDMGTTSRPGARFGPKGVRRASAQHDGYSIDRAIDLKEELDLCDAGDVFVIPANIEKSFDQISKAISFIFTQGAFPIICGGDHSIGFPTVRGIAPHIDGNIGIIHIDRHLDIAEKTMDERMHGSPWYWVTHEPTSSTHRNHAHMHQIGLPNCRPQNLVQMAVGGWTGIKPAADVAHRRGTQVITIADIEKLGIPRAAEIALENAWEGCKAVYLSFDIDAMDSAFAPGTGTPEPGGLLPREAFEIVQIVAREGLCGMEIVEVAPPYDVNDNTSQLACNVILHVLGSLVEEGKIGHRSAFMK